MLQRFLIEIQQQSYLQATHPKISEQLCLVHSQDLMHRLDFKDERLLDQYIDPQIIIDNMALIDHR